MKEVFKGIQKNFTSYRVIIAVILVFSSVLFLVGLGNTALTDPDETFYAQAAKEMAIEGEWMFPILMGKPKFEKPVFFYWMLVGSYKLFGINEFSSRLPSAIFGVFGILGVYLAGRLLFSKLCGVFSAIILATNVQYIYLSKACVTDMTLTVFILFTLVFFLMAWIKGKKIYYVLASIMAAFSVLTKGPVGLLLSGMITLLFILLSKQWEKVKNIPFILCFSIFLLICLPWYIITFINHGDLFINEFFMQHNFSRFAHPVHPDRSSPFYYIAIIFSGFLPWTLFLPKGIWKMYRDRFKPSGLSAPATLFLLIWFIVVFMFFSISSTKLITYVLPLFPVLAIVVGRFFEKGHNTFRIIPKSMIVIPSIVLVIVIVTFINIMPRIENNFSSKEIALKVSQLADSEDPVGGEDDHRWGIAFYLNRDYIENIHPYNSLKDFLNRKEKVWCLIQDKHYRQVKEETRHLVSEPLFRSGKYVIVTNKFENKIQR